ncbi:hypothetical protein BJV78DRAFT_1284532 [Lactifluus subvellereus]|nr:hypothetical protein BJV78DRAFT_1284532 [Lactifluus subvellereus]
MRHDPATIGFIERMAQDQLRYGRIFTKQAESPLVAKPGKRWEPTEDKVDEYLARCDDICHSVPQDFDDRVKISYAAHAALMCLVKCKFAQQPDSVQLATMKRHNDLSRAPPFTDDHESPQALSNPSVEPRRLTAEEHQLFQNPDELHGKQFVLSPDTDDSGTYEVIGYHRKRDKSVQYDVLFDDCDDPILLDAGEMMRMLEDSLYLPN